MIAVTWHGGIARADGNGISVPGPVICRSTDRFIAFPQQNQGGKKDKVPRSDFAAHAYVHPAPFDIGRFEHTGRSSRWLWHKDIVVIE
jgi:hypothetical protein